MNLPIATLEYNEDALTSIKLRWGLESRPLWAKLQSLPPSVALKWADRFALYEGIACEWSIARCFEAALQIEVPARAQYLRSLHSEIQRVLWGFNSLFDYFTALDDVIRKEQSLYLRELMFDTMETLSGARVLPHVLCLGGIDRDLTRGENKKIRSMLQRVEAEMNYSFADLDEDNLVLQGIEGVLPLKKETATRYFLTGPVGHASGYHFDLRRDEPYGAYEKVRVDSFANTGQLHARAGEIDGRSGVESEASAESLAEAPAGGADALMRLRAIFFHIRQSIRLSYEILDLMPEGDIRAKGYSVQHLNQMSWNDIPNGIYTGACEAGSGPIFASLVNRNLRLSSYSTRLAPFLELILLGVHRDDLSVATASLGFDIVQGDLA